MPAHPTLSRRAALAATAVLAAGGAAVAAPPRDTWLVERSREALTLYQEMEECCIRLSAVEYSDEAAAEAFRSEWDRLFEQYEAVLTEMSKVPALTATGVAAKVSFLGVIAPFGGAVAEGALLDSAGKDARRLIGAS